MNLPWGLLHAGLQTVLDTALDAVVVMDTDGMVIGWNAHSERVLRLDVGRGARPAPVRPDRPARPCATRTRRASRIISPPAKARCSTSGSRSPRSTATARRFPVELSITASEQFGDKLFIGFIRDISERKAEAERQQRILQESEHRVKNMLTVVQAIALQTAANSPDMDKLHRRASRAASKALARAHQLLVGQVWQDVAISALAERVLGAEVAAGRARFGGPELLLKAGQVLGLSMILHELYTNAVKYGALCSDEGQIELDWASDGDDDRADVARDRPAVRSARRAEQRLRPADDRDERQVRPRRHDRARLAPRRADRDAAFPVA